ncbi:MAG TPA: hypothetical protein VLI04_23330 [Nocardioidaceae bacterium]|nr:hypothetical protein [Nocardioidaceae bacterium]
MLSKLSALRRPTAAAAIAALAITLLATPEPATSGTGVQDPDRNSKALTGWGWHTSVTPAVINAYVAQGNRIVDLELTSNAPKFSATYVVNSGPYARAWWWYFGKTGTAVKNLLEQNNARLTDIEPYSTANGTRYAVVMVKNTGIAKKAWGWHYNVALSTITSYAKDHGMRVVDVDRNPGGSKFSAIYIKNAGVDAKGWWHYYNVTANQIKDYLKQHKARILQLERKSSTRYDVVLQKRSGEYWWWLLNMTQTGLSRAADQLGARIFQVKSRVVNGKRKYDALLINDVNNETTRIRQLVGGQMTGDWGFYVKKVGGAESVALGASNVFEPASMMKIVHVVTALREIQESESVDENTSITWYANPDFPARYPGDTGYRTPNIKGDTEDADVCAYDDDGDLLTGSTYSDPLGSVIIKQTLQQSDNRTTDALTLRYGFGVLNLTKILAGMTDSKVNHRIGCNGKSSPEPLTHNQLTLRDAGKIYEGVQNLSLLDATHRAKLYGYLLGGPIGEGDLRTMVYQEAAAAGLSIADRNLFVSHVATRSKGGSYGYCPNFDGSGTCDPPSVQSRTVGGIIWLPFKGVRALIVDTPFVYGRYFDSKFSCTFDSVANSNCSAYNKTAAGNKTISVEMFRSAVKAALASW